VQIQLSEAKEGAVSHLQQIFEPLRQKMQKSLEHMRTLEVEYREMLRLRPKKISAKFSEYHKQIKAYRLRLKAARIELECYLETWMLLLNDVNKLALT
jgi:hypothetical protein